MKLLRKHFILRIRHCSRIIKTATHDSRVTLQNKNHKLYMKTLHNTRTYGSIIWRGLHWLHAQRMCSLIVTGQEFKVCCDELRQTCCACLEHSFLITLPRLPLSRYEVCLVTARLSSVTATKIKPVFTWCQLYT